jgi:hypothetical protein
LQYHFQQKERPKREEKSNELCSDQKKVENPISQFEVLEEK